MYNQTAGTTHPVDLNVVSNLRKLKWEWDLDVVFRVSAFHLFSCFA